MLSIRYTIRFFKTNKIFLLCFVIKAKTSSLFRNYSFLFFSLTLYRIRQKSCKCECIQTLVFTLSSYTLNYVEYGNNIVSFSGFPECFYYFVCCNRYNGAYSYYYRYEAEGTKYYRLESGSLFVGYIPRLSVYGEYDTQSVSSRYFFVCQILPRVLRHHIPPLAFHRLYLLVHSAIAIIFHQRMHDSSIKIQIVSLLLRAL